MVRITVTKPLAVQVTAKFLKENWHNEDDIWDIHTGLLAGMIILAIGALLMAILTGHGK